MRTRFSVMLRTSYESRSIRRLSIALLAVCGACAPDVTGPAAAEILLPRTTVYRCVGLDEDGNAVIGPTGEGGTCAPGFDMIPWW